MHLNCKRCNFKMVKIHKDTIFKIIDELKPNFLSLPSEWESMKSEWIQICLRCDSYPLGFEMERGYPIRTQSGDHTTINDLNFVKAHDHRECQNEILSSELCGCFACLQTFNPNQIDQWHGDGIEGVDPVALCPNCSVDSVIGDKSGYPIEQTFLKEMRDFWFSPSERFKTIGA